MINFSNEQQWDQIIKATRLTNKERLQLAKMLADYGTSWEGRNDPQYNPESMLFLKVYEAVDGEIVEEMPAMRLYYPNYGSAVLRACYLLEDLNDEIFQRICINFNMCEKIAFMRKSDLAEIITVVADLAVELMGVVPAITVSTLICRYGLDKYCNCSGNQPSHSNAIKPLTARHISFVTSKAGTQPNNTYRAFQWVASIHARYGREKQALHRLQDAEKTIRSSTDPIKPLNDLAYDYIELNKYEKAVILAQEVADAFPIEPAPLDTLGWALVGTGELDRAINLLEKAVALDSDYRFGDGSFEIRYHLVVALLKSYRRIEATKIAEQVDQRTVRENEWLIKINKAIQESRP